MTPRSLPKFASESISHCMPASSISLMNPALFIRSTLVSTPVDPPFVLLFAAHTTLDPRCATYWHPVPVSLGKIENAVLADAQQWTAATNPRTITTSKRESMRKRKKIKKIAQEQDAKLFRNITRLANQFRCLSVIHSKANFRNQSRGISRIF